MGWPRPEPDFDKCDKPWLCDEAQTCVGRCKSNTEVLHVGPANMVLACGGREVTNGITVIRLVE